MAPMVIADLFFFDLHQPADLAISLLLGALRLANPIHHCEKNPALSEINLLSRGAFDRGAIGDLFTWHRFLRAGSNGNETRGREFQFQLLLRIMCPTPSLRPPH